jgi:hypothetical protein
MSRCVVNVSTGQYLRGQNRLRAALPDTPYLCFASMPPGSPGHQEKPFAFKAFALQEAAKRGYTTLLWADACMLPIRDLEPLWEKIEDDGYYICNNGWINGEWCADSAYTDLGISREDNWRVKHVVAGVFGIDLKQEIGRNILSEYARLAMTNAFRGPTWNSTNPQYRDKPGAAPCGPPEVRGHRHDQTALSVIAWREGCRLTDPPEIFAYRDRNKLPAPETIIVADSNY